MEERRLKNILKTNVKMCIILIFGYTFFMILQNQSTDTIIAVDVSHTVVYLVASYNCYDDIKNSSTIKSCLLGHTLTREFDTSHKLLKALFIGIMYFFWIFFYLFRVFSCVLLRVVV